MVLSWQSGVAGLQDQGLVHQLACDGDDGRIKRYGVPANKRGSKSHRSLASSKKRDVVRVQSEGRPRLMRPYLDGGGACWAACVCAAQVDVAAVTVVGE